MQKGYEKLTEENKDRENVKGVSDYGNDDVSQTGKTQSGEFLSRSTDVEKGAHQQDKKNAQDSTAREIKDADELKREKGKVSKVDKRTGDTSEAIKPIK
ncbi:unnamed protein product [Strongylus vulgaris]|uniref:Uncharacterized protein n=1 Tax=Strongylus vulgaris TaxID=40348 RepID=A0A3P7M2I5_STRVU|nr:unnamed protein product [Strongylus vulgaris]